MHMGGPGAASTTVVNTITMASYVLRRNAGAPALAGQLPLLGGPDFTAESLYALLGTALGIPNAGSTIGSTDYIAGVQVSDP